MIKKLDLYIIKKFLGTYIFSIMLIMSIAIVIDITEKIDNFYSQNLSLHTIVFDYYVNFIPYYMNLFSAFFTFISVIWVTSKLAFNSEIIAMLASGISFKRIMVPYLVSAAIIAIFTFYISSEVIPKGNRVRYAFEQQYIDNKPIPTTIQNIQMKVSPNEVAYIERYELETNIGYNFSLDKFKGKTLVSRLTANNIKWDSTTVEWTINNYLIRNFNNMRESTIVGAQMKKAIDMYPQDFVVVKKQHEQLTNSELRKYIDKQTKRGVSGLNAFRLEYEKRFAMPFAAFILTLIGVSVASRKTRGGTGLHIMIGFLLSVTYILATMVSASLTVKAEVNPTLAIWTPNIVYFLIGAYLYKTAPK